MHVEIQVALNFLISFLYNKLPRRRVNQFGEELENALKKKFEGHWYPEKPFKGSAFRCLKTAPPLEPVFEIAAREAGMELADIQENLAPELSIWIDPGEVSYRMSEKGPVKILYSEFDRNNLERSVRGDREVTRTFNPEAQCFKPIESMTTQFGSLSVATLSPLSSRAPSNTIPMVSPAPVPAPAPTTNASAFGNMNPAASAPYKSSSNGFPHKSNPVTFTTATFAATKFGSTKLKTNGKRSHRMSPTEFSNYIKQRAILQQQTATQQPQQSKLHAVNAQDPSAHYQLQYTLPNGGGGGGSPHNSRSISPTSSNALNMNALLTNSTQAGDSMPSAFNNMLLSPSSSYESQTASRRSSGSSGAACISPSFSSYSSGSSNPFVTSPTTQAKCPNGFYEQLYAFENQEQQERPNREQCSGNQLHSLNRLSTFLEKASPFVSTSDTSLDAMLGLNPLTMPSNVSSSFSSSNSHDDINLNFSTLLADADVNVEPSLNVESASKAAENTCGPNINNDTTKGFDDASCFGANNVSYPNQYQYLLLAN